MAAQQELHVVFGTGALGLSVMHALMEDGKRVRMVNRSGKADVPAGVELAAGDAYNADRVHELTRCSAAVYQCAQPRYTEWPARFPPLQASILEGTAASGAKFIVAENLYMYGDVPGPLHEGLSYEARTRKGKTRAAMSEAVMAAHRSGKVRIAIARGSDFFGPGALESSLFGGRFIPPSLQGRPAQLLGNIDLPHTYTYVRDFGRTLAILGQREEGLGQIWHVPNAETLTSRQLGDLFFKEIGKPARYQMIHPLVMRMVGLFVPDVREMVEMAYEFEKPFIVESGKFTRAFGLQATPLPEAVRETVAWFKQHAAAKRQ